MSAHTKARTALEAGGAHGSVSFKSVYMVTIETDAMLIWK